MTNYSRPRILCIDDDTSTSTWIRIVLRGARINASVVSVQSGMEALRLVGKEKFDLCILDYALPDMTGVQLCTMMRHLRYDVPVMFLTALDRPVDRERASSAGADEFLRKPDDLDVFADAVFGLLKRRNVTRTSAFMPERVSAPPLARAA